MHIGAKAFAAAFAVAAIAVPLRSGWADEFAEKCVAAGGGMFKEKECACIGGKAESDERADLIAFFEANIKADKNGTKPDENDPQLQKGFAALNKYGEACSN
jgi:hypothetical protein